MHARFVWDPSSNHKILYILHIDILMCDSIFWAKKRSNLEYILNNDIS